MNKSYSNNNNNWINSQNEEDGTKYFRTSNNEEWKEEIVEGVAKHLDIQYAFHIKEDNKMSLVIASS